MTPDDDLSRRVNPGDAAPGDHASAIPTPWRICQNAHCLARFYRPHDDTGRIAQMFCSACLAWIRS